MTGHQPPVRHRWAAGSAERGSAAVELTLLTPLLLLLALVVVAFGRLAGARLEVTDAAHQAARAASVARTPATATAAARQTAAAALAGQHLSCATLSVDVDTSTYRPGGTVAVQVACTVDLSDLTLLHLPGHRRLDARSVSALDVFRGTG